MSSFLVATTSSKDSVTKLTFSGLITGPLSESVYSLYSRLAKEAQLISVIFFCPHDDSV